jgi:hypothetical protein
MITNTKEALLELNVSTEFGRDVASLAKSTVEAFNARSLKMVKDALNKIDTIQKNRNDIVEVSVGDYVLVKENEYRMVANIVRDTNDIQLYPQSGHYCCLYNSGEASASGTLASPINADTLTLSDEVKQGSSWSFLFGAGANKGVNFDIDYKVWELKD